VKVLVTVAHPDDEAFGCGSLLADAAARGVESVVVCATRGELGEPAPGSGVQADRLGAVREAELRVATSLLGVRRVEVLDWLDSGVGGEPAPGSFVAAPLDDVADRLATIVADVRPDVVVTLDASDGHRDHAHVRDATLAAVERSGWQPARVYLWCLPASLLAEVTGYTNLGTPDDEITTVVDTSQHLDLRWRAMRAHASQVPPYDAMAPALQHAFLATDRLRRLAPPWTGGPVETDWLP
jgi:N-acetyl-1-D-myo-inositol-2-amino-2-deoxy-alpha-D-glucopyranoside deacetylase